MSKKEEHLVATWSVSKIKEKLDLIQKTAIITALVTAAKDIAMVTSAADKGA